MKKILPILFVSILMSFSILKAQALTFEEAFNQSDSKPMLVVIYANWADGYQNYLDAFSALEPVYGDKFNYVTLDIASEDARFFNDRYHIYPKLPYILMFKDGGKVSRYVQRECILNNSCLNSRIKSFIQ